jgi:lipid biosynthesis B12-binding/radical SAM protein
MAPEVNDSVLSARCLIVSANRVITPYPVYPLGAACLVSSLKEKGHTAEHFDILADGGLESLGRLLERGDFDIFGVSIRNLDSVDSTAPEDFLPDVKQTVDYIRERVSCPVVLGGPAFSIMPEIILDYMQADYGVVGEGEELLPWLVQEIVGGSPPRDKLFYSAPLVNAWKPADLSPSTAGYYLKRGGMLNVQTKRGCPYHCAYCSYPNIEGKNVRYRDPGEVAEEVIQLRDKAGAQYIFFADSYFNDGEGHYLEVAEALAGKKNSLPWCAFFRPDIKLGRAELRLLKKSGLAAIELGTDAACDATLAGLGKSFTFSEVLQVSGNIAAEEIPCAHYVIFGGPGENGYTLREGLKNLDRLERCVVFAFTGIRILPGTRINEIALAEGIVKAGDSLLHPVFYFSPEISKDEIEREILRSFTGRIDRIYPCQGFGDRVAQLHQLGKIGPLWDYILL